MITELNETIMNKSKTKTKYLQWLSREIFQPFKKQKTSAKQLTKKANRHYFEEATKNSDLSNKNFWKTLKPFLTNKGY